MNLEDVLESLSRLDASYINYVDGIESLQDIKLTEELPSAYIIYLQGNRTTKPLKSKNRLNCEQKGEPSCSPIRLTI